MNLIFKMKLNIHLNLRFLEEIISIVKKKSSKN